jgi:L-lactate dehydrogenase complex protein LldG
MTARDVVLDRARAALGETPAAAEPARNEQRTRPVAAADQLVARFCDRVVEYRATATRVPGADDLPGAMAVACAARGTRRVVRAPGEGWSIPDVQITSDSADVAPVDLDASDAALTGCALAIAETGTIVLDGGPSSGRRALSLVPDHHLCVVRASQVVADLPAAIAALTGSARAGRPLTFVSGPSATSDIELERVEGVHGPRKLDVFVLEECPPGGDPAA